MGTEGVWEINAWKLFFMGGPLMWPILLCSIISLTIIIEKMSYLRSIGGDVQKLKRQVYEMIKNNKIKEAVEHCDNQKTPVAKVYKAALLKFGSSREEIKENIDEVSLFEVPQLEARLSGLATIGHVSPLLGLLGTVVGMLTCFQTIQVKAAAMSPLTPGDLAGGVAQALITTIAGLVVAIPTFIFYNYFISRINRIVLDMERAGTEITNRISQITEGDHAL